MLIPSFLTTAAEIPSLSSPATQSEALTEHQIAQGLSQTGTFLTSGANLSDATNAVAAELNQQANNRLSSLLNPLGTVNVSLNTDKTFSLKNSAFSLLAPLWQDTSWMLFNQTQLHHTDERRQLNTGFGLRYITDNALYGGNLFYDYDLSERHRRLGSGLEYGRDYLKLSANYYARLSEWRASTKVEDYDARPATGWDLRANAYLPSWPQLGGKVAFEQYYGDDVALFNRDNRLRNPYAMTAGLSYTPFPLMTVSAEQRLGKDNLKESRLGVQFTLGLGTPLHKQLSADSVAATRSLAGSRHDLVDRNNNIVLDYKKQQTITLSIASALFGMAGERKSMGVNVTAPHGLSHLEWSAAPLLAAGGQLIKGTTPYQHDIVLPAWNSAGTEANRYALSAVAVDTKGNRSAPQYSTVTVNQPLVNAANSLITPENSQLPADGVSQQILRIQLRNDDSQVVDQPASAITFTLDSTRPQSQTRFSPVKRIAEGDYHIVVTAGSEEEEITLHPLVAGITLQPANIQIVNHVVTGDISPKNTVMAADGKSRQPITLFLKDAQGRPASLRASDIALNVESTLGAPAAHVSHFRQQAAGQYELNVTASTTPETLTLTPSVGNTLLPAARVTLQKSAITGSFSPEATQLTADGVSNQELRLTLKDENQQPANVNAADIGLIIESTRPSPAIKVSGFRKVSAGLYAMNVTAGKVVETVTLKPTLTDNILPTAQVKVTYGEFNAQLTPLSAKLPADGKSVRTYELRLRNAELWPVDLPLNELALRAESSLPTRAATLSEFTKRAPGVYRFDVTAGLKPELLTLFVTANTKELDPVKLEIMPREPYVHYSSLTLSASELKADGKDAITLTLAINDVDNVPVDGIADQFKIEISTNHNKSNRLPEISSLQETSPGVYTATLTGTQPGSFTLMPVLIDGYPDQFWHLRQDITLTLAPEQAQFESLVLSSNEHSFSTSSGFPKTGFVGARFMMKLTDAAKPEHFVWRVDQNWLTVNNQGEIRFTAEPSSATKNVTLTATAPSGYQLTYRFTVDNWFVTAGYSNQMSYQDAVNYCSAKSAGYALVSLANTTTATQYAERGEWRVGYLFGEWGSMYDYENGWGTIGYWTSDKRTEESWGTTMFTVWASGPGETNDSPMDIGIQAVACHRAL